MSQDLRISPQLQQLIVVVSQIVKLRDQKQQQSHKNRLKLLITLNNILTQNKNIQIKDASIQIASIIDPSLQHPQDIASFLYNILFIFITQTLEQQARVVDVNGFKNLHLIFTNNKIMQFFEKDVVFSAGQLNVDERDKFIDGLQWILYKAFSQLKNNIYYAALNNVMCEISKKQEIFIFFNFDLVSDCFLFISDVAFNLNKHKLITLLIQIFKEIQTITQNSEKFKQFSKNISVNTHKQLKSCIETIIKQIQRDVNLAGSLRELLNKLKQQIELTLNDMGLNLLSNQSIEKRLIGLRMMYHDIINEQIYFQWIKSKNVFQLILKETSHNAFVDSSGFIFKLVIRHLKNNKSYLNKILQYINNSTPQIRKSVLKHIEKSSIFQYVPLYGQILQKLFTNQNPEFYTSQLVDLIYKLLPKASYHHNSIIIQKLIKVYLQLSNLKNQKKYVIGRCKDLINSSLVRNLQKKTSSTEEENQKFNTVFSIYEFLLSEPINIEKICLSNSITKKIIQKFSITREQKQRIIEYLLKQKKIIENSMKWITEWTDARLKQEIQNFFCTLMEDLALKLKKSLIQNTQILIEATGSIKIFKKLIVMFESKLEYLKDNFSHFISKAYLKNYPTTFTCISFYFFYINSTKINYNSKLIDINCEPSELVGIDVLKKVLMSSEMSISRDEIAEFISNLYTNYSDVVKEKCQKYLQTAFTQISKQFSNMWFLSSAEENLNEMLGFLALVYYLMVATQYCGVGAHKSFNQLVPINYVTVIAKNQAKKSAQILIFQARLPSNMLFFDALVLICYQFDYDISSVQTRYQNKVLDKKLNSLSLEQMKIDGKVLLVSNTKQNFLISKSRRQRILLENQQLSPKALQALTQLYHIFCPQGKMTEIECIQFIKGVTKSAFVSKNDARVKKFMQQYDLNKDGIINLQDFIRFYYDRADESATGDIWLNLNNMGYRYDLKKYKSPVDPLPDRLMLRTYLAQEQEIYETLFQMLKVDHDELKARTIKILRRLPQYKSFLAKFEQNFQFSSKQIFQIEYYLILVQKDISQKGGVQRAQQFFHNRRTEIIFQIMSNFLAKQTNNLDDKKCLFLSIKILRSLCSIQKLVYRPNYIIYSPELYLSHLKNLNYDLFIKKLNECLKQQNIEQIQCMFTLLLQQNLIKKEKKIKKMGLDEALTSIFNNIEQIRQIACNFIFYMSINKEINETPEFKMKINSFFHISVQKNSSIWFETLINILPANQYYIDFEQIINRCLNQLLERKQSLQNPYDEIIEGYLQLLYTIKVKRDIQLSFQRIVNIAENVFFCRSRKLIYHILSLIDYDKAIFYVKQLILNVKKGTQNQIIPKNNYIGFNNLGSTCYINSILQLFFSIKRFRDQIITINIKNQTEQFNKVADQGQQLLDEIIKLCVYLEYGQNKFYDMTKFCQLYKNKNGQPIDIKKQEDAHEFYGLFLQVMEVYFQKSMKKDIFEKLFTGKTAYKYICTECQYQKIIKQKFSCLTLQIQDHRTLEESLDNFTKRQQIQDYDCENCNKKVKVRKQTNFWEVPEYLTISLKRIFFDFSKYKNVKISSKLQFPQTLDLKKYAFSQQMALDDEYLYELKAVVIHSGSCLSGHYYSIIKMKQKWFKFDDQNVSEYNIKNLENEGYGKDEQQENYADEEYPRSKNAYILCYKKTKIKQKEEKQCHPSSQLMQIVQEQKMFMIDKMKIYNDSAFQFCIELFQALKTPQQQQQNQLYNKQWKNDENCQKYNQLFQLAVTLQNFLLTYWKLNNPALIPNLCHQICTLFYLIPQKSYNFISKIKTSEITQMLCFHESNEVKQMYKHILTKGVYIFYQYYKFKFESDDQVAKHFSGIFIQLLYLFDDEKFYQHAMKLQMFFQFWKIMLDCVQNLQNYLLRSNLLAYLTKIIISDSPSKQNGSQIDDSVAQKQKQKLVPESIGKLACNLIFSILKKKNVQIQKYLSTFGNKISTDLQINQKQRQLLTNSQFYFNILKYNQDRQKVLSQTITYLAHQKEEFSKNLSIVFLRGLRIYQKKNQIIFTMMDYIKNFLKIKDNLKWYRLKWVLGIWQLQMGYDHQFGFSKKDVNSNLYRYVSNLNIHQSNKYQPIFQFLIEYKSIQQKIVVYLSIFVLELILEDDIAPTFLKNTPSPTCIYNNYFDWLQSFKQKLAQIQPINFPIDKSAFIQKFMSLYSDLREKIKNEKGTEEQQENPVRPYIIGRNNKLDKIKQDQFVKYKLTLYAHETFILENLPTGKQNLSIPSNFFTKPESRYFLSKYEKYNQVNNRSYKHLVQKKQTMLTLQIQSEYNLKIEFDLKQFNQQVYVLAGKSTINFPYQDLQQELWKSFLTVQVLQDVKERQPSEEIKMQLNQEPLNIIEDNRSKHCSRCTLLNQIQAKQCEACSLEFY